LSAGGLLLKILTTIATIALTATVLSTASLAQEASPAAAPAPISAPTPLAAPATTVAPPSAATPSLVQTQLPSAALPASAAPGKVALLPPLEKPPESALVALAKENALLLERLRTLEGCSISSTTLASKNSRRLKDIAADIRVQRQGMADFENYVKWMSTNIAGYAKYISAGSVAAGFAKVLPIPYAGQASVFTKFVSNAALSLGAASVSISKYLATSQQFLSRADALDPAKGVSAQEVSELVRFADQDLLKGMVEVQERLTSTSELSTSSLSFLESLNHYMGSTDEYWTKTKSLLKSGDDKKEKSYLSESTTSLRNRAQVFNGKFKNFAETVKKDAPLIKSLVAYDDLIREIDPKFAKLK
jgi:hypothetical protein